MCRVHVNFHGSIIWIYPPTFLVGNPYKPFFAPVFSWEIWEYHTLSLEWSTVTDTVGSVHGGLVDLISIWNLKCYTSHRYLDSNSILGTFNGDLPFPEVFLVYIYIYIHVYFIFRNIQDSSNRQLLGATRVIVHRWASNMVEAIVCTSTNFHVSSRSIPREAPNGDLRGKNHTLNPPPCQLHSPRK